MGTFSRQAITSPLNVMSFPNTMASANAKFVYLRYKHNERSESNVFETDDNGYPPRYVQIDLKKNSDNPPNPADLEIIKLYLTQTVEDDLELTQVSNNAQRNIFFAQDFTTGFVRLSDNTQENNKIEFVLSDALSDSTILSYIKNEVNVSEYIEDASVNVYENYLKENNNSELLVIDSNTNQPITTTPPVTDFKGTDSYLSSYHCNRVIEASKVSPMVPTFPQRTIDLANFISDSESENKEKRFLSSIKNMLISESISLTLQLDNQVFKNTLIDINGNPSTTSQSEVVEYIHYGFHVTKYLVIEDSLVFKNSFTFSTTPKAGIPAEDFTIRDPYILYGQTYKYEVRDVYLAIRELGGRPIGSSPRFVDATMIIGTENLSLFIESKENLPPPPPAGLEFSYSMQSTIKIDWQRTENRQTDIPVYALPLTPNEPLAHSKNIDDVGGYIIFVRNSLEKPYQILRQLHISETIEVNGAQIQDPVKPEIVGCVVPSDLIVNIPKEIFNSYSMPIRSNIDYFIAMASYDKHGNLSNYSEQFLIRRNNVTGEVIIKLVSQRGAPLAYPNTFYANKFVLSSITTSGYKYLDICQVPDTTNSYPDFEPNGKGVVLHLIDLDTEADVIIESTTE